MIPQPTELIVSVDRKLGDAPAMSDEDIADIVAFLRTLTDGFSPAQQAPEPPVGAAAR